MRGKTAFHPGWRFRARRISSHTPGQTWGAFGSAGHRHRPLKGSPGGDQIAAAAGTKIFRHSAAPGPARSCARTARRHHARFANAFAHHPGCFETRKPCARLEPGNFVTGASRRPAARTCARLRSDPKGRSHQDPRRTGVCRPNRGPIQMVALTRKSCQGSAAKGRARPSFTQPALNG